MAKVLLVDDDVDLVAMNTQVLEAHGHTVISAYSGDEARELLEKEVPDVAVLDVMMESMSAGFNLARDINRIYPKMPMLMLSGVEEKTGIGFKGLEDEQWLPICRFIDKPISPDELARAVESILGK